MVTNICPKLISVEPGRPAFDISAELLEDLLGLGFSHTKIAEMLGVSRWTISRRIKACGLDDFTSFSKLSDDVLDQIVGDYLIQHGATSGQVYIAGYLRSLGLRVQRRRVRKCIARPTKQHLEMGNPCFPKGLPGTMAQFIVTSRWPPFLNKEETSHPRLYRWLFKENYVFKVSF